MGELSKKHVDIKRNMLVGGQNSLHMRFFSVKRDALIAKDAPDYFGKHMHYIKKTKNNPNYEKRLRQQ